MQTFFYNDLIQLHNLRHVASNQVFIIRKTTSSFTVLFARPYKQSIRCQDICEQEHSPTRLHDTARTFSGLKTDHISCGPRFNLRNTASLYTQSNKNPSAWNFVSPELEVTWRTVAIIIRVLLLSPYLRIRGVSLSSIHYNQSHRVYINRRQQYTCLIWNENNNETSLTFPSAWLSSYAARVGMDEATGPFRSYSIQYMFVCTCCA